MGIWILLPLMENSGLVRRWLSWLPLQSSSGTRKKGRWVLWGVILSLKLTMPPFLIEISPLGIDAESGRTGVPWLANSHIGQIHTSGSFLTSSLMIPRQKLWYQSWHSLHCTMCPSDGSRQKHQTAEASASPLQMYFERSRCIFRPVAWIFLSIWLWCSLSACSILSPSLRPFRRRLHFNLDSAGVLVPWLEEFSTYLRMESCLTRS
mmetsp:Transcript_24652/g.38902  ORF Transcript_24652/g.38902 Transcript_24652/m.38902 type:complete len:207 (-) Transcript_24652:40-660(-)